VTLTRNHPELSMCKQKRLLYHKTGAACLLLLYLDAFDYNTGVSLLGCVPCIILQKRVERQKKLHADKYMYICKHTYLYVFIHIREYVYIL